MGTANAKKVSKQAKSPSLSKCKKVHNKRSQHDGQSTRREAVVASAPLAALRMSCSMKTTILIASWHNGQWWSDHRKFAIGSLSTGQ